jgi:hypothetical protein
MRMCISIAQEGVILGRCIMGPVIVASVMLMIAYTANVATQWEENVVLPPGLCYARLPSFLMCVVSSSLRGVSLLADKRSWKDFALSVLARLRAHSALAIARKAALLLLRRRPLALAANPSDNSDIRACS